MRRNCIHNADPSPMPVRGAPASDMCMCVQDEPVQGADGEASLRHLLLEPVDLSARVAVDDGLRDRERLVEVAERGELPLLLLDVDKELLDTREMEREFESRIRVRFRSHDSIYANDLRTLCAYVS